MAKTKLERIEEIKKRKLELENQEKKLLKQHKTEERKVRDRRLYKRAALLESLLPETIPLSDEQFTTFLNRTVANSFGKDKLSQLIAESKATKEPVSTEPLKTSATAQNPKTTEPQHTSGTSGNSSQPQAAARSGA